MGELLCEATDVHSGDKVLDVATGSGNTAISAARRFCDATGIDYVPELIEQARKRAEAEGLEITFEVGDAEDLPYPDASFDLVVLTSVFTHMLPTDMEHYVDEIARVLKPGGRCFATYSLLNPESRRLMESGSGDMRFKHAMGPCAVVDPNVPELAVAYEEDYVRKMYEQRGLSSSDGGIYYGSWLGREPSDRSSGLMQDVVLTVRR
jgi:ubiquinone/menaquinone biosynthesis C-methylase UbiE